jgi:hypothetical protein
LEVFPEDAEIRIGVVGRCANGAHVKLVAAF